MSRATEIAEREAAEVEAEPEHEPDEAEAEEAAEQERETEVEPEPEPEPSSLAMVADQEKQLDAEQKRHAKALAKALGDHWPEFALCPLCQVDGYAMVYGPGEVSPEQREAIATVLGENREPEYVDSGDYIMCAKCDGQGMVLTNAKRLDTRTAVCKTCGSNGYIDAPFVAPPPPIVNGANAWTPPPPPYDPAQVNKDPWGRELGNPNWGIDPATNGGVW